MVGMSCDELEGNGGKADIFDGKPFNAECAVNLQCSGDLVCRNVSPGVKSRRDVLSARDSAETLQSDRWCDSITNDDCVDGDICQGSGGTRFGTCESESYRRCLRVSQSGFLLLRR